MWDEGRQPGADGIQMETPGNGARDVASGWGWGQDAPHIQPGQHRENGIEKQ